MILFPNLKEDSPVLAALLTRPANGRWLSHHDAYSPPATHIRHAQHNKNPRLLAQL